jgi:hypothetical protein
VDFFLTDKYFGHWHLLLGRLLAYLAQGWNRLVTLCYLTIANVTWSPLLWVILFDCTYLFRRRSSSTVGFPLIMKSLLYIIRSAAGLDILSTSLKYKNKKSDIIQI